MNHAMMTIKRARRRPTLPTTQPVLRYRMTPKTVRIDGVKTPMNAQSFSCCVPLLKQDLMDPQIPDVCDTVCLPTRTNRVSVHPTLGSPRWAQSREVRSCSHTMLLKDRIVLESCLYKASTARCLEGKSECRRAINPCHPFYSLTLGMSRVR